jgi:hypothetical protein
MAALAVAREAVLFWKKEPKNFCFLASLLGAGRF